MQQNCKRAKPTASGGACEKNPMPFFLSFCRICNQLNYCFLKGGKAKPQLSLKKQQFRVRENKVLLIHIR